MPVTRDPELEAFKTPIDLRAYAASLGYALDKRESWRGSSVMRHGNGYKVIVKKDHDQHFVYFSVRDERDNGSIIDFAMRKKGLNLGQARKELRPWAGGRVEGKGGNRDTRVSDPNPSESFRILHSSETAHRGALPDVGEERVYRNQCEALAKFNGGAVEIAQSTIACIRNDLLYCLSEDNLPVAPPVVKYCHD